MQRGLFLHRFLNSKVKCLCSRNLSFLDAGHRTSFVKKLNLFSAPFFFKRRVGDELEMATSNHNPNQNFFSILDVCIKYYCTPRETLFSPSSEKQKLFYACFVFYANVSNAYFQDIFI